MLHPLDCFPIQVVEQKKACYLAKFLVIQI